MRGTPLSFHMYMTIILIIYKMSPTVGSVQKNVYGLSLQVCSFAPMAGYYRDGYCHTGPGDYGSHTVCAVITEDFLNFQKSMGNDLVTPRPQFDFPGLKPGDRWAVCAKRWLEAYEAGIDCKVVLGATNIKALDDIPIEFLEEKEYKEGNVNSLI